MISRSQEFL